MTKRTMGTLRRVATWMAAAPLAVTLAFACTPKPSVGVKDDGGTEAAAPQDEEQAPLGADPQACEGPLGAAQDPQALPACCPEYGNAHCVQGEVGEKLSSLFGACDGGGTCVDDKFIATGGVMAPQACTSLSEAPGRCLSLCAPNVAANQALLPQDVCDAHERCVPCISPLDGSDTGACRMDYTCEAGYGGETNDPGPPPALNCPHEGDPIIDPKTLPTCAGCGLGHCVSSDSIPNDQKSLFAACNDSSYCVPDKFIETGGNYIAPTCESTGGFEGRCMSTCLPDVAAKADSLPQSTCGVEHLCVPCFDPVTGESTGVCTLSCDPGPQAPEPETFDLCCNAAGSCVPTASVPEDQLDDLPATGCKTDGMTCVPHMFLNDESPKACSTTLVANAFGEEYRQGVCLPSCLPATDSVFLLQDDCDAGQKCAPCLMPPNAESSGACDL